MNRNRHIHPCALAAATILLALACCASAGRSVWNVGGIHYDLPSESVNANLVDGNLRADIEGHRLEVVNGQITYDGAAYGPIGRGDTLRLTKDGQVFINGERREPRGD